MRTEALRGRRAADGGESVPGSFHHCKKFITSEIIDSFSSGFDSAIMSATATSVLSAMRFSTPRNKMPLRSRKYRNRLHPMRLFPSVNEWFLMIRIALDDIEELAGPDIVGDALDDIHDASQLT